MKWFNFILLVVFWAAIIWMCDSLFDWKLSLILFTVVIAHNIEKH